MPGSDPLDAAPPKFAHDSTEPSPELTRLLVEWSEGNAEALAEITPIVYNELRRLARSYMRRERADHTLQSTAVVHEAYIRLIDQNVSWNGRAHFFGIAAQMMRRILVDHARAQGASKRGSGHANITLEEHMSVLDNNAVDVLALDQAMERLASVDPQRARLVELKFFGGLSKEEIAEIMGTSPATVQRQWAAAKAWLFHELQAKG